MCSASLITVRKKRKFRKSNYHNNILPPNYICVKKGSNYEGRKEGKNRE